MTDLDLFIAALEKHQPSERDAWLDDVCAGDPDRRRRVGVLLRAHNEASQFLAEPLAGQFSAAGNRTWENRVRREGSAPTELDVLALLTPADQPGQLGKLAHYEVLQVVGRGGMGVVLKAFDPKLHRLVAVKLMAPHLAAHAAARQRFEREARAVAAVRNEHVVAIHGVEAEGATPYLVMEFIGGISLQDRLEQRGSLEVKEILRIGLQVARGLAAAHAQGLVHRDVKPANILLENGVERVKITDFGLARAVDDANLTQSGAITGTPNYMSPEQASGATVDSRSDLFSLGSVLYALCTGHPPFRAETPLAVLRRVCDEPARNVRDTNPDIPDWLDALIQKLLAKKPGDRFQSASEVADLLAQSLAHLQQPNAVPKPAIVRKRSARRARMGWVIALNAVVAVALVLAFRESRGDGATQIAGNHDPVYRLLSSGYMIVSTAIILFTYWVFRTAATGRWERLVSSAAIVLVVLGTGSAISAWWGIAGLGSNGINPEVWFLAGIFSASLLVNLPSLFRRSSTPAAAGRPAKPVQSALE